MKDKFGKLERIKVEGYRSIKLMDLKLEDLNIIIGPNGVGKSNFINLFKLLGQLANEELQLYVSKLGGANRLFHFGRKKTSSMSLEFKSDANTYKAAFEATSDGGLVFTKESVGFSTTEKNILEPGQKETSLRTTKRAGRIPKYVYTPILNWRVFHFHDTSESAPLRQAARIADNETLRADGGNLPAYLYFLQEEYPEIFEDIEYHIRRVAPFFNGFRLKPDHANEYIRLSWRHRGIEDYFDSSDLSDGTLRFIALTTLILQPDPPSSIVLDEPELGLHPFALHVLAGLMQSVCQDVQIICSTQSVSFANQFSWDDIVVADRENDTSVFRRLTEEEVKSWLDEYAIGDLWEKNIIGGRPQ